MLNFSTKEKRTIEEELYSIVVEEIESNILHKPLWAKALVDSNGTDKNTQAFYIQLRVQKLYDEMQEKQQQEDDNIRADKRIENTRIKNENTLATLDTIVVKLLSIFKYLTGIMWILGLLGLFLSYFKNPVEYHEYNYWLIFLIVSIIFSVFGWYLFFESWRISKITDRKKLKKKLNLFFIILIPFSAIGIFTSLTFPLLGFWMFISCIFLIFYAIKFNLAYLYGSKNKLF